MKVAFFDTHLFEKSHFDRCTKNFGHTISYLAPRLGKDTAQLANGFPVVCSFANDKLDAQALQTLKKGGTKLIALRSAGYNHVDLKAAQELGLKVVRVPAYSPYSVAEHAVALILGLNRKTHRAHNRIREGNFSLEGLVGFDLHGKTVGIIGTGRIGTALARILGGFGCRLLGFDLVQNSELVHDVGIEYVSFKTLCAQSDIISLHVPLTTKTHHLINASALSQMKKGVMLINTGRGRLVETHALIDALKTGQVGNAGLDVYEEEEGVFFEDHSNDILQDDVLARLTTFPNVLITSHQGFLTHEALANIAETTLRNITEFENNTPLTNEVCMESTISSNKSRVAVEKEEGVAK